MAMPMATMMAIGRTQMIQSSGREGSAKTLKGAPVRIRHERERDRQDQRHDGQTAKALTLTSSAHVRRRRRDQVATQHGRHGR